MKSIRLELDWNCYSTEKERKGILGATEHFFIMLDKWLVNENYFIDRNPEPQRKEYDLVIFSNVSNDIINAEKSIIRSGSIHTNAATCNCDVVVNVSEHMKKITGRGIVIHPPVSDDIVPDYRSGIVPHRIVSNGNPNKYMNHMIRILDILDKKNVDYHFMFCGGNKLYSEAFPECFDRLYNSKFIYKGIISRKNAVLMLSSAHIYVLPAFTSEAPTFEVAPLEAMRLMIPTILPNKSPYNEIHGPLGAALCNNEEEFADKIIEYFKFKSINYDVSQFFEENIKRQWLDLIRDLIGE